MLEWWGTFNRSSGLPSFPRHSRHHSSLWNCSGARPFWFQGEPPERRSINFRRGPRFAKTFSPLHLPCIPRNGSLEMLMDSYLIVTRANRAGNSRRRMPKS